MRRWAVVLSAFTISLGAATTVAGTAANAGDTDPYTVSDGHAQAGPMGGIVPARDSNAGKPGGGGGGGAKPLNYHGGPVQHLTTTKAIFWGPSWANATFVGNKISGLDGLYQGLATTNGYGNTNKEYTDGSGHVNPVITYSGSVVDTTALTFSGGPSTSAIVNEVINKIGTANIVAGGYYPVYVDAPRGSAGYCAWHSYGSSGGKEFQVGFFFNLDGDGGCDPKDTVTSHGQPLASLANVSGHEYSEMVTDPLLNAWYDVRGQENADKCAWTFPSSSTSWPVINGQTWKIQGNFSNAANNTLSGYDRAGCIDTAS
jgi:hypothetical protein